MTTPSNLTSGTSIGPEMLLRQVIMEGLQILGSDELRLQALFRRLDDLRHGTHERWQETMLNEARTLVDFEGPGGLRVGVGYPDVDTPHFPYVSILLESGREAQGSVGDVHRRRYERIGNRVYSVTETGSEWSSVLQVGSWTTSAERSHALHEMLRSVFFHDKGRLHAAGVYDLDCNETGFVPDPQWYPRVGYCPTWRVTMDWTYTTERRRGPLPTNFTLGAPAVSITGS